MAIMIDSQVIDSNWVDTTCQSMAVISKVESAISAKNAKYGQMHILHILLHILAVFFAYFCLLSPYWVHIFTIFFSYFSHFVLHINGYLRHFCIFFWYFGILGPYFYTCLHFAYKCIFDVYFCIFFCVSLHIKCKLRPLCRGTCCGGRETGCEHWGANQCKLCYKFTKFTLVCSV